MEDDLNYSRMAQESKSSAKHARAVWRILAKITPRMSPSQPPKIVESFISPKYNSGKPSNDGFPLVSADGEECRRRHDLARGQARGIRTEIFHCQ